MRRIIAALADPNDGPLHAGEPRELELKPQADQREDPLFLTHRGAAYSRRGRERGWSGFNKTAFNAAKRRAVKAKRRQAAVTPAGGDRERAWMLWAEAALLAQVTRHWLRHWFATHALAAGMSLQAIAAQGGWRKYSSIEAYAHDVPPLARGRRMRVAVDNETR